MHKPYKICAIGEALWDIYHDARFIGGSPVNVVFHLQQAGNRTEIVTRLGKDSCGDEFIARLKTLGVETESIQRDPDKPTGQVCITLDQQGQPTYHCSRDVAFDYLAFKEQMLLTALSADAVYFDTLGQRHELARSAIRKFLAKSGHAVKLYDLNLTGWNETIEEIVEFGLQMADIVQMNQKEIIRLHSHYSSRLDNLSLLRFLFNQYDIQLIALTRGAQGCLLVTRHEILEHRGYRVPVVDVTGCGDAFSAMLLHRYLGRASLDVMADDACRLAAFVAAHQGATPEWRWEDLAAMQVTAVDSSE